MCDRSHCVDGNHVASAQRGPRNAVDISVSLEMLYTDFTGLCATAYSLFVVNGKYRRSVWGLNFPSVPRLKRVLKQRGIPFNASEVDRGAFGETTCQGQAPRFKFDGKIAAVGWDSLCLSPT